MEKNKNKELVFYFDLGTDMKEKSDLLYVIPCY